MDIEIARKDGVTVISPKGNVDYVTAPELDEAVEREAKDASALVFDLSDVSYISSAGLRSLLNADELMEDKDGIKLTNVGKEVRAVLDMTNFSSLLKIERGHVRRLLLQLLRQRRHEGHAEEDYSDRREGRTDDRILHPERVQPSR